MQDLAVVVYCRLADKGKKGVVCRDIHGASNAPSFRSSNFQPQTWFGLFGKTFIRLHGARGLGSDASWDLNLGDQNWGAEVQKA